MTVNHARQRFFDYQVHMKERKDNMSGNNEISVMRFLEHFGYEINVDYVRQHPIGDRFVLDFAFIKEKIAIEVDGKDHLGKENRRMDKARDKFCYSNGWVVIRIPENKFFGSGASFYRYLIKEVVEERRKQWQGGRLYKIDIEDYNEKDYE